MYIVYSIAIAWYSYRIRIKSKFKIDIQWFPRSFGPLAPPLDVRLTQYVVNFSIFGESLMHFILAAAALNIVENLLIPIINFRLFHWHFACIWLVAGKFIAIWNSLEFYIFEFLRRSNLISTKNIKRRHTNGKLKALFNIKKPNRFLFASFSRFLFTKNSWCIWVSNSFKLITWSED